jgi:hypothetical protein
MPKPSIQIPDVPEHWTDPSGSNNGWAEFNLPDGQKLGDVVQQHRTDLQHTVERLQSDPNSLDGGLGYVVGHYLGMARPHGEIDFKNKFKGQGDPDDLAKAGNFAYYAIGSGILPDSVLDAGASVYNLYKHLTLQSKDHTGALEPDASAKKVRDAAIAYGVGLK